MSKTRLNSCGLRRRRVRRAGITIIEVLTSILVAMIGMFGVLIMIPFAVSQAEQGLNQEGANSLALNAVAEFEIRNYIDATRWSLPGAAQPITSQPARPYLIDPIGVGNRLNNGANGGQFPFVSPGVLGTLLQGSFDGTGPTTDMGVMVDRVSLASNVGAPAMGSPLANHVFAWKNNLVSQLPTEEDILLTPLYEAAALAPPTQFYDQDDAGNALTRQSVKDLSYTTLVVPVDVEPSGIPYSGTVADRVEAWRSYFIVTKNRPQPVEFTNVGAGFSQAYDRVFEVATPGSRIAEAGGDLVMTELAQTSSQPTEISRGDWIMLTNVSFSPVRQRFIQQINFFQVVDAGLNGGSWEVTLQGPDFDFYNPITDSNLASYVAPAGGSGGCTVSSSGGGSGGLSITPSSTYAVHLPDVLAVFERTLR